MVIEQLRQNARAQAALEQERRTAKTRKRRARRPSLAKFLAIVFPPAIATHSIFLPALGVWGALTAGLGVLMLSSVTVARISMFAGLGALGSGAAYIYAALAAVIGALSALIAGLVIQRLSRRSRSQRSVAVRAGRQVRPIDPSSELGSESLDTPIEDVPFSSDKEDVDSPLDTEIPAELYETQAEDEAPLELEDVLALAEDAPLEGGIDAAPEAQAHNDDEPVALDLGAFDALDDAELATEDGAPVQAPVDAKADAPNLDGADLDGAESDPALETARTGIEKLRQSSPDDLSLVQLVERFAAALHDIQDRAPHALAQGSIPAGNTERERALAEALKALALFSDRGFAQDAVESENPAKTKGLPGSMGASFGGQADRADAAAISETEQQLREALTKLQTLRGAA